jgi:RimJ/RimL family protein N-acetyltransferase
MNLQPYLENELVKLTPLQPSNFDALYEAASDPLVWEQHPNPNRYQKTAFENYFKGAIDSKGAFLITDAENNQVIGSSRFYNFDEVNLSVVIGYTFLRKSHWGGRFNMAVKSLQLDYAFQFVHQVIFHVGSNNIRSQKAMEKLGASKISTLEMAYHGEPASLNFVYHILKQNWDNN